MEENKNFISACTLMKSAVLGHAVFFGAWAFIPRWNGLSSFAVCMMCAVPTSIKEFIEIVFPVELCSGLQPSLGLEPWLWQEHFLHSCTWQGVWSSTFCTGLRGIFVRDKHMLEPRPFHVSFISVLAYCRTCEVEHFLEIKCSFILGNCRPWPGALPGAQAFACRRIIIFRSAHWRVGKILPFMYEYGVVLSLKRFARACSPC